MIQQAKDVLLQTFGYNTFRPLQEEIITHILNRNDTLVIMPTGGGKSLCYQIPALVFDGLTIVVSPLISLMKDQVEQLREVGVSAVFLNSSLSQEEYRFRVQEILSGKVKLLYVAPETLLQDWIQDTVLNKVKVSCITIDEAHCISEWGHDFRPEYRQISAFRARFPDAVCVALTATATPEVQKDIAANLKLNEAQTFLASFDRTNLFLEIRDKSNPNQQVLKYLEDKKDQSGIIYCFSRKAVDDLTNLLQFKGFKALPYHAGLSEKERSKNQEDFIRDNANIIVATIAFGMGINKPDVRYVIHFDLPKNIESYYQQIGRAGRDGLRSECMLLFSYGDTQKLRYFINDKTGKEKEVAEFHLQKMLDFVQAQQCRRQVLMPYFGENYSKEDCGMCDVCTYERPDNAHDYTTEAQKFLSCVVRTGESFGAVHIVDVLRGSKASKILQRGHDQLSTYGIGVEWSKEKWLDFCKQLILQKALRREGEYAVLVVTELGMDILKGRIRFKAEIKPTKVQKRLNVKEETSYDGALFQLLRRLRKEIADSKGVPPFVIFSDQSLIDMSKYFPMDDASFLDMHGVGKTKMETYGEEFIAEIKSYCDSRGIESIPKFEGLVRREHVARTQNASTKKRHHEYGELFEMGKSISEIARSFTVKEKTVIDGLAKFVEEGFKVPETRLILESGLSATKMKAIFSAIDDVGHQALKPIYEALNEKVSYDDIRFGVMIYKNRNF